MESIAGITFTDIEDHSAAFAGVRAGAGAIAVMLSRLENSDTEVLMSPSVAEQFIEALQRALVRARASE